MGRMVYHEWFYFAHAVAGSKAGDREKKVPAGSV